MHDFKKHENSREHDMLKVHVNFPVTDLKEMEIYNLPEKELKKKKSLEEGQLKARECR